MEDFSMSWCALVRALTLLVWAEVATPLPRPALTLGQALAEAAAAPRRLQALALAEGARSARDAYLGWENPLVELRSENWQWGGDAELPTDTFLTVSQNLPRRGERGAWSELLAAEVAFAEGQAASVSLELDLDVASAYLSAVLARAQVSRLAGHEESLRALVSALERRVAEGRAAEGDWRKVQAEQARLSTERMRAELELRRRLLMLASFLGRTEPIAGESLQEPPASPVIHGEGLAGRLVAAHPEVAAARALSDRARRTAALEQALGRSRLAVIGGYKRTAGQPTGLAALQVHVPLFDTNQVRRARAEGERRAAELELARVELWIEAEMNALVETARVFHARSASLERELLAPAATARIAALARFREGAGDILEVVDAERVWSDVNRESLAIRLEALLLQTEIGLRLGEEIAP
jgi:outer membrane protein TolC